MLNKATRIVTYSKECRTEDQAEVLYTCPTNCRAMMTLLFISNANGNTSVDIMWYRENGSQHIHIIGGKNMTAGEFLQFDGATIVFEPGDYMTVTPTGNTAPHLDALCTVEEVFIPVG